jgi:hypothetical protein
MGQNVSGTLTIYRQIDMAIDIYRFGYIDMVILVSARMINFHRTACTYY